MGTITGYTAAHMDALLAGTIASASVVSGNLILTKRDGSTSNAGSVIGPTGATGSGADPTVAPPGVIHPYAGVTAPSQWVLCDGSSLPRTGTYAALFAVIGVLYGSIDGTHFNLPDLRQRVPMGKSPTSPGNNLGAAGGSKDLIVVSHGHSHSHAISVSNAGAHGHSIAGDGGERIWVTAGGAQNNSVQYTPGTGSAVPSHVDPAANHSHTGGASVDATVVGSSGTDANLPPYLVVNYIIRY